MIDNNIPKTLSILQYNVMKSVNRVMAPLFANPALLKFDIIALQEPWRNPYSYTTYHPLKSHYTLIYPPGPMTRTCFYVNKRLPEASWVIIHQSADLCAIQLKIEDARVIIYNIYNPCHDVGPDNTLSKLTGLLNANRNIQSVLVGDLNLHHPLWGGEASPTDPQAEQLISLLTDLNLQLLTPPGTTTWQRNGSKSTIDLAAAHPELEDQLMLCEPCLELDHDSDHIPIQVIFTLNTPEKAPDTRRAWKLITAEAIQKAYYQLGKSAPEASMATISLDSGPEIDTAISELIRDVVRTIDAVAPLKPTSPRAVKGFTPECKEIQAECRRLRRYAQRRQTPEAWDTYRETVNRKCSLFKKSKRDTWREAVKEASESPKTLWRLAKWARNREGSQRAIPPIQDENGVPQQDPINKSHIFQNTFFPTPRPANLRDIPGYIYPEPLLTPPILQPEVQKAILRTPGKKAPGPDQIPNHILHKLENILTPQLTTIFNACLRLGYYPEQWRNSITVVIKKPAKEKAADQPKSYRPIALLNTTGKIFDAILATRLAYLTEKYQLLPGTHFGARGGRSTESAIHYLLEQIYAGWNETIPRVATLLTLDIAGAFDRVNHQRLIHCLRQRRVPAEITQLIISFLAARSTQMKIGEHTTDPLQLPDAGIPQGSSLSPILFLFYNANLIEACHDPEHDMYSTGYVDDQCLLAIGRSTEENCARLAATHQKCNEWSQKHASQFAPAKYELVHLTRQPKKFNLNATVTIPGDNPQVVKPAPSIKYLGVRLDTALRWGPQIAAATSKATKSIQALGVLAASTWGLRALELRQLYQAVVVPQLGYAASVWWGGLTQKQINALHSVQKEGLRVVTGAFRATARTALEIETFIPPIHLSLQHIVNRTTLRMASNTVTTQLILSAPPQIATQDPIYWRQATRRWSPLYKNIQQLIQTAPGTDLNQLETITPHQLPPWYQGPAIYIDVSAETASAAHNQLISSPDHLAIYSDGSGIQQKIGAAAVCPQLSITRQMCMGTEEEGRAGVYTAELQGIRMAVDIAKNQTNFQQITIFVDNQAAIRSTHTPGTTSGQCLATLASLECGAVTAQGKQLTIRWIPAHTGVAGNELADIAAKRATGWFPRRQTPRHSAPALAPAATQNGRILISTVKTQLKRILQKQWASEWTRGTTGRQLFQITDTPTKKTLRLHYNQPKWVSSLITQLRTGKIGLNQFLFHRKVPGFESGACPCGEGPHTPQHLLISCDTHRELRRKHGIRIHLGMSLRDLLGQPGPAKLAAEYIKSTGSLLQFAHV